MLLKSIPIIQTLHQIHHILRNYYINKLNVIFQYLDVIFNVFVLVHHLIPHVKRHTGEQLPPPLLHLQILLAPGDYSAAW